MFYFAFAITPVWGLLLLEVGFFISGEAFFLPFSFPELKTTMPALFSRASDVSLDCSDFFRV
jgi:hypothetical protein